MQTIEEILLRVGVDGKSINRGLDQVKGRINAWGATIGEHFRGIVGAWFGFQALERGFDMVKERILAINRLTKSTGFGSNFIQGAFGKLGEEGENFEKAEKPLANLTALAGKQGMSSVKFIEILAERYKSLNTQEERNLMLQNLHIKNWQALIPLLEEGAEGIRKMNEDNFFTKMRPETLSQFKETFGFLKSATYGLGAFGANIISALQTPQIIAKRMLLEGKGGGEIFKNPVAEIQRILGGTFLLPGKGAKEKDIELEQQSRELLRQKTDLMQEQVHLQEQLNDMGKESVSQMASEARHLTGAREPRHTMTPRLRTALKIDTLEKRAEIEWEKGIVNDPRDSHFWSEAQQLRAASPWMKAQDRDQTKHVTEQIDRITEKLDNLEPIAKMAEMVTNSSSESEE